MMKGKGRIDYNKSNLTMPEKLLIWGKGLVLTAVISYLFYQSVIMFIVLLPITFLTVKSEKRKKIELRKKKLLLQFKDGIALLLSGLEAGYSIENSFKDACRELRQMYQRETDIEREYRYICASLELNEQLDNLLIDFGKRSGLEDVRSFAEVFIISKHRGGDITAIVKASIYTIQEKIEVNQEIDTLLSGKKLEQNIMNLVPLGILLYVNLTSPEFISSMYKNIVGAVIMSVCLIVYVGAYMVGKHLIEVEI